MEPTNRKLYNPKIDQLRAVGFLAVCAVHFFNPEFKSIWDNNLITQFLGPLVNNGHFGVSLFFFLSGYVLSRLVTNQKGEIAFGPFLLNRVFRIYPVWIICVAIVMFTAKLKAGDVLALLGLFIQNLPPSYFNIAWSVQTEMYLYLLFPILFANVTNITRLGGVVAFFLLLRGLLVFMPTPMLRDLSYSTILGAIPLFSLGILSGRSATWQLGRARRYLLVASVALIWCVAYYIEASGGFLVDAANAKHLKPAFLVYPEIMGVCFFLLVKIYDSETEPFHNRALQVPGQAFALIGKISYSGYMFHIFVLDLFLHMRNYLGLTWVNPFVQFTTFLLCLFPLAFLSFKVVEEPFLKMRRKYIRPASLQHADSSSVVEVMARKVV